MINVTKGLVFKFQNSDDILKIVNFSVKKDTLELEVLKDSKYGWNSFRIFKIGDVINNYYYTDLIRWIEDNEIVFLKNYKGRDTKLWKVLNKE